MEHDEAVPQRFNEILKAYGVLFNDDAMRSRLIIDLMQEIAAYFPAPGAAPDEEPSDFCAEGQAAIAYQVCGALNAPAQILDYFSAVAQGEKPSNPLPFCPEAGEPASEEAPTDVPEAPILGRCTAIPCLGLLHPYSNHCIDWQATRASSPPAPTREAQSEVKE